MKNYYSLFLAVFISIWCITARAEYQYTIVVDAGSSGSRLHIFQYDTAKSIPAIQDIYSMNVKPGISSYADHPEASGESLKNLLDAAVAELNKNGVDPHTVSIHILATAGMRLLPEETQQMIYANISNYIQHHYPFSVKDIKTISGKIEGLYGWLDVNYLLENFQHDRQTVGTIDMGGASTQIAFATANKNQPDDIVSLKLGDQVYTVFSKSFLGLGQDQARSKMSANLSAASCYPPDYALNATEQGNFNMEICGNIYADLIKQYGVSGAVISTEGTSFVAYSGIYYAYNFFNIDKTPSRALLEARLLSVCRTRWDQLVKDYPQVPAKYISNYCADGVYHKQLLYGVYQLKDSQLTVATQINQKEIDWTLGSVLYSITQH